MTAQGLGKTIIRKSNGTTLYITRDVVCLCFFFGCFGFVGIFLLLHELLCSSGVAHPRRPRRMSDTRHSSLRR